MLLSTALWLCRRLLFTGQIPAGTDAFDLVARAQQNAHWNVLLSPWSPVGLGSTRQASLDNFLGLLVLLTGDAPRTVAVLLALVLLASGVSAYCVVSRWYGDRLVGTIAGLVYMTSQASIGRVASGWLHYELLIALAPVLIHLWISVVDRFDWTRALVLGIGLAAIAFARQDVVLWIAPAFVVYAVVRLISARDVRHTVSSLAKGGSVVLASFALLSLYFVVPLLGGIRAPWVTTGQVFEAIRFNLLDRSLDAYQSFLGLGRDMGYLPFNGEAWWNFHPWFPQPIYYELQSAVVAGAIAALWFRRDTRTLYLVLLAVVATFLGKGIRGPFGSGYWLGVENVPVFGSLRGPNRWLMEQSFCYATLFAVTIRELQLRLPRRVGGAGGRVVFAVVGAFIALVPVAPTLLHGFRTWEPTVAQTKLMTSIASDPGSFSVATVPYDQSMRYMSSPAYSGWEHDLGVESSLYTRHSALSTNSWDQRGSDFVDFTASLLERRDPAFARLLGSVGVGYLLGFGYASETALQDDRAAALTQQHDLALQPDARPVLRTAGGSAYRDTTAAPLLSFRTNLAVILGGRGGLAAFADRPGIHISDWAVQTADDLLGGARSPLALTRAMDRADVVVVADSTARDLGVVSTRPVARLPGITSDPGLERRAGLLLNDESARLGSLADPTVPPPALVSSSRTSFRVAGREVLELWARVLFARDAGYVTFTLDGRRLRRLLPLEPGSGRFAWIDVGRLDLRPGTHSIDVTGTASAFGKSFELDESRVLSPTLLRRNTTKIQRALRRNADKVDYVVDVSGGPYAHQRADQAPGRWRPQASQGLASSGVTTTEESFGLVGARPFYTFATRTFPTPQAWGTRSYAVLRYWSSGVGTAYQLLFDFDSRHRVFASYPLPDISAGWHTEAVPITASWKHVVDMRVSTKGKSDRGRIVLGPVQLLFSPSLVKSVSLPVLPSKPVVEGASQSVHARLVRHGRVGRLVIRFPRQLVSAGARVWVVGQGTTRATSAVPVAFHADGDSRVGYSFQTSRRGMLVLAQSYDAHWQAAELAGTNHPPTPVMSLVSGFVLGPGVHAGFVEYRGSRLVSLGVVLSLAALLLIVVAAALLRRTGKTARPPLPAAEAASLPDTTALERSALVGFALISAAILSATVAAVGALVAVALWRAAWRSLVIVAVFLTLLSPLLIALGRPAAADALSVAICVLAAAAVARLLLTRRGVGVA